MVTMTNIRDNRNRPTATRRSSNKKFDRIMGKLRYPLIFASLAAICVLMLILQASLIPYLENDNTGNYALSSPNEAALKAVAAAITSPQEDEAGQQHQKNHDRLAVPSVQKWKMDHQKEPQLRKTVISNNNNKNEHSDVNDPFHDKAQIMEMLKEMNVDPYSLDNGTWAQVPTWEQVTAIWGSEPRVYGRQHCEAFKSRIEPKQRRVAVAGIFSTGTNLLAQLLQHNCGIPERVKWLGRKGGHGMYWQVVSQDKCLFLIKIGNEE